MRGSEVEIVNRARLLLGARFRPQGRDTTTGLDCVGLVVTVFRIPVAEVPRNYRLRGRQSDAMKSALANWFSPVRGREREAGDVMLCVVRRDQMHLAIHCGHSFVHADARLRRVVETPGEPPWPIAAVFRHRRSNFQSS